MRPSGKDRGIERMGIRPFRRVFRFPVRADDRGAVYPDGQAFEDPGGRRRRDEFDHRLRRPGHLRPVRRRSGSGPDGGIQRRERHPGLDARERRQRWSVPVHARRREPESRLQRNGKAQDALRPPEWTKRLQVCRQGDAGGIRIHSGAKRVHGGRPSGSWCLIRPT